MTHHTQQKIRKREIPASFHPARIILAFGCSSASIIDGPTPMRRKFLTRSMTSEIDKIAKKSSVADKMMRAIGSSSIRRCVERAGDPEEPARLLAVL